MFFKRSLEPSLLDWITVSDERRRSNFMFCKILLSIKHLSFYLVSSFKDLFNKIFQKKSFRIFIMKTCVNLFGSCHIEATLTWWSSAGNGRLQHLYSHSHVWFALHPWTHYRAAAVADGKALSSDVTRLGVPVADLRRAPVCSGPLPALKPTDGHTVMVRVSLQ